MERAESKPTPPVKSVTTPKRSKTWALIMLFAVLFFGSSGGAIALLWWTNALSLPDVAEVQSMMAEFHEKGKQVRFSVPADQVEKVLASLSPASRDWSPSKWVSLGRLTILHKDGTTTLVDFYKTSSAVGAFSVHAQGRPRNSGFVSNYFRGGSDKAISDAVNAAFEAAKLVGPLP